MLIKSKLFKQIKDVDFVIKQRFGLDIFSRSGGAKKHSLSERVIRNNKRIAKERIRENILITKEMQEFFFWICSIQKRMKLNDQQFANLLNLNSSRSIRQYRNLEGHFPSKRTVIRLLQLERLLQTCVYRYRRYANGQ